MCLPICVIGDFYDILDPSDKWGGTAPLPMALRRLRSFMNSPALIDIGYQGPAYTWHNAKGEMILE